ncbi:unnamed protein product [Spirodela intermedia]|uniref:Uncharacterized protein n=2 Tax=Spirodela intermedia TaxID=51605 RepID=A0A7I8L8H7_SPIIN|nr:unnamed protein product [Spirodela intermedia]CAA7406190.1 unnamed protein product [Spirodela intermedia]
MVKERVTSITLVKKFSNLFDGEWDPSPSAQETPTIRVQPDRHTKIKEPSFRYTA